jgi:predicted porin
MAPVLAAALLAMSPALAQSTPAAPTDTPSLQTLWQELQGLKQENRALRAELQALREQIQPPPVLDGPAAPSAGVAAADTLAHGVAAPPPHQAPASNLLVYGALRGHIADFGDAAEVQDASPRVGFRFDHGFGAGKALFVGGEFGINFFDNTRNLSLDPNGREDFASVVSGDSPATFSTRLGYIGLDLAQWGRVSIGKQYGVFNDVAGWPDMLNVLSGKGEFVFAPTGTDGGEVGTGRADNAVLYRNTLGKLQLGLQTQMNASAGQRLFDSVGVSVRYPVLDGLTLGAAYQQAFLNPDSLSIGQLRGLDGDPTYFVVGFNYQLGPFALAGIYNRQDNGNFVTVADALGPLSIFYGADGIDLMGRYAIGERWQAYLGFSDVDPDIRDPLLDPGFRDRYYTFGLERALSESRSGYYDQPRLSVYVEGQLNDSRDASGVPGPDVFLLGLRYLFDHPWSTGF